jgi:peptide/nickel transport system substrate-binding protein
VRRRVRSTRGRWLRLLAVLAVLALVAAGCGGGGGSDGDTAQDPGGTTGGTTGGDEGDEASGEPTPGGKVVYALEAESTGGFCLYSAQLAISGIMVTQSIYDTLTVPNADGEYVPYLAESIEPNETFDSWVITLRDGVTFHNGEALDGEAVKLNLDSYRGANPDAFAPLFTFVFQNIDTVEATGPLEVTVTTKTPWPAFPAYLFSSGRLGIMAPEQIADTENCSRNLIGTGPFQLDEWVPNDHLTATKYADYWRAEDGLPYLDEIEFRPVTDGGQRVNGLETGGFQAMHTSGAQEVLDLRDLAEAGQANLEESSEGAEVGYTLLNDAKPPFDDLTARQAVALAVSEEELNELINDGLNTLANGPMAPGTQGFSEDTGYPAYDPDRAKELVQEYKDAHGGEFAFELTWSGTDPSTRQLAEEAAQQLREAGIDVTVKNTADQSQFINDALGGNFDAFIWRNHGGTDGDLLYVWFHSGSPVNFSKFVDPEVDRLLDEGRAEIDPDRRDEIYAELNQRFGEQVWELWSWYTLWGIATAPNVHGILGPELPDGDMPFPLLAGWHLTSGLWIEQ